MESRISFQKIWDPKKDHLLILGLCRVEARLLLMVRAKVIGKHGNFAFLKVHFSVILSLGRATAKWLLDYPVIGVTSFYEVYKCQTNVQYHALLFPNNICMTNIVQ